MFTPSNTRSFATAQDDPYFVARVYTERSERVQDDKEKVNMMIRNGKQDHVTGVILRRHLFAEEESHPYIRGGGIIPLDTPPIKA